MSDDTQHEARPEDQIPKMEVSNVNPYGIITDEGVSVGCISHGRHALQRDGRKAKIAKVFAAAGIAAHEAGEMGYDPQKALENLPELLQEVEDLLESGFEDEGMIYPGLMDVLQEMGGDPLGIDALSDEMTDADE